MAATREVSTASQEPVLTVIGRIIAHYRILDVLGEGGMGVVYLAEDLRLNRKVALKALSPRLTADRRGRRRLEHEARAAARLSHPGIAAVYALEEDGPDVFIVSEHVVGLTLRSVLRSGPVPLERLVPLAIELADAIAAAHAQGVIHRDLKPDNVLVSADGHVKVLDFGIARMTHVENPANAPRLTADGQVAGTIAYMSPEQLRGQEVDPRSDIFSLGVVLYEAATGRHPFERPHVAATIASISADDPPPLDERPSDLRLTLLGQLLLACLAKRPDDRYQSMSDVVRDLQDIAAGDPPALASGFALAKKEGVRHGTRSWWSAHQLFLCGCYVLSLLPMWRVREWAEPAGGLTLFFGVLVLVVMATTRRAHLRFTAGVHPDALPGELSRSVRVIIWLDRLLAAAWLVGAVLIGREHNWWAALLVVLAAGRVIEPATTRAAFGP